MLNRKASLYALVLVALTACTKQEVSPDPNSFTDTPPEQSSQQGSTVFGLMDASCTADQAQAEMNGAGINLVRLPVFLSQTTIGRTVNEYLLNGFNVQVNLNWAPTSYGPVAYPTDLGKVKQLAESFFKYYAPYKNQMPFVVIENEWDNTAYHMGGIQNYLNELSAVTDIAHKYGFKVADAGITSTALQRWMYSQLSGTDALLWKSNYFVGLHNNYELLVNTVNTYINGIKRINIDYLNVHWYNTMRCGNGFGLATQTYMKSCAKTAVVCNEFGIRTSSVDLFNATVTEIKGNAKYGVAYSGTSPGGQAVKLTGSMLDAL